MKTLIFHITSVSSFLRFTILFAVCNLQVNCPDYRSTGKRQIWKGSTGFKSSSVSNCYPELILISTLLITPITILPPLLILTHRATSSWNTAHAVLLHIALQCRALDFFPPEDSFKKMQNKTKKKPHHIFPSLFPIIPHAFLSLDTTTIGHVPLLPFSATSPGPGSSSSKCSPIPCWTATPVSTLVLCCTPKQMMGSAPKSSNMPSNIDQIKQVIQCRSVHSNTNTRGRAASLSSGGNFQIQPWD